MRKSGCLKPRLVPNLLMTVNSVQVTPMLRDELNQAMKQAMKAKDTRVLTTVRLINAAIKQKDIEARTDGADDGISEADIQALLMKMIKQRLESIAIYKDAGRDEQAAAEQEEILVIERFLPEPMSDDDMRDAVNSACEELGASGIKDMGPVMNTLRTRYAGQMDMAKASSMLKERLTG